MVQTHVNYVSTVSIFGTCLNKMSTQYNKYVRIGLSCFSRGGIRTAVVCEVPGTRYTAAVLMNSRSLQVYVAIGPS